MFERWSKFVTKTTEQIKGSKHNLGSGVDKERQNEKVSHRRTAHRAHGTKVKR